MSTTIVTAPLELQDVSIRHGRRVVAGPITLTHYPGSILWIVGENGAGKSSLLRAIAGRGKHAGIIRRPRADLGFYHPAMRLPTGLTVAAWLDLHRVCFPGGPDADVLLPRNVDGAMDKLSTGEAKRLQLWALLRLPRSLYVLDEPFEHLSPAIKPELIRLLATRATDACIVASTNQDIPVDLSSVTMDLDS